MGAKKGYLFAITLVATLGGLLFGYDTAVISGATKALKAFFITPLENDGLIATKVILQYKWIVTFSLGIILALVINFFYHLFGKRKAAIYGGILLLLTGVIWYHYFWSLENVMTESMANALKGFIISSALLGCIMGGAWGGFVSRVLGRKNGMLLAAFLFMISAIGSAWPEQLDFLVSETITAFIFFRVIGGIGVGLASMIVPMYIAEIAPSNVRGQLVSWNQFAIIFGMLVVYFVNYGIARQGDDSWVSTVGWRWMFASETIPAGLFFFLLFLVPETPRYLVMVDKTDQANGVLKKIVGENQAPHVLKEIKDSLTSHSVPWMSFGGLVIIIGILLSVFQQFVGINVVLYYAPEIFQNMGSGTDTSLLQTIIVGIINLSFTVLAIFTVDRFGRKPLMIIGALGMAVSMLSLGTLFYIGQVGYGALFFMLLYVASFAMSWGPVCWVLLSEIFPNSIRSVMSIAVAAQWVANLTISWTFPMMNESTWLTETFNHGFPYWIYGMMGVFAALFLWKMVPETKGKTLEEIEQFWKKRV